MSMKYLGFVLLICFAGVSQADMTARPCPAPSLNDGYVVPEKVIYFHEENLTYSCNEGHKPAVEGWWAQITCENGKWSQKPQCIDDKSCLPPTVPHGKYQVNSNGWYRENRSLKITCHDGYVPLTRSTTARCADGVWSTLPVCQKSSSACSEPPKSPNAVIIDQEYQEVFAAGAELKYECKDGYTTEEADTRKSMVCTSGQWEEGPACRGQEPSSSGTSAPAAPGGGNGPSQGDSTDVKTDEGTITSAVTGTQAAGAETTSSFGSHDTTRPLIAPISLCGSAPIINNSVVVEKSTMFIKYQCNTFYKQVGLDTVTCYSDRTWSTLPVCEEFFCVLDPSVGEASKLDLHTAFYLKDGDGGTYFYCKRAGYYAEVTCKNRIATISPCCTSTYHGVYCY